MRFISVWQNVIASNNKQGWVNPQPALRVSGSEHGKVLQRAHSLAIKDANGNTVAKIISTQDGTPVVSCGAKVAIVTEFDTQVIG